MKHIYSIILFVFLSVGLTACNLTHDFQDVVESTIDGVVIVSTEKMIDNNKAQGLGTGFFIKDNIIVTNSHVVEGADSVYVKNSKSTKRYKARVLASDSDSDIAILSIYEWNVYESDEEWKALKFYPSQHIKRGQVVWTFGHPWGLDYSISKGIISSVERKIDKTPQYFIQVDAKIFQGNSGGPLLDEEGRVIGVNSRILSNTGGSYGFSLAGDFVQKVIKDLSTDNKTYRVALGVSLSMNDDGELLVQNMNPNGIGLRYGIRKNDVLQRIISSYTDPEGRKIINFEDLLIPLTMLEKNEVFWIQVRRNNEVKLLPLVAQGIK